MHEFTLPPSALSMQHVWLHKSSALLLFTISTIEKELEYSDTQSVLVYITVTATWWLSLHLSYTCFMLASCFHPDTRSNCCRKLDRFDKSHSSRVCVYYVVPFYWELCGNDANNLFSAPVTVARLHLDTYKASYRIGQSPCQMGWSLWLGWLARWRRLTGMCGKAGFCHRGEWPDPHQSSAHTDTKRHRWIYHWNMWYFVVVQFFFFFL